MDKNENYYVYLLSFLCGALGIILILALSNMLGANGYSVIGGDLLEIYIPVIKNMYRDIWNGEYLFFSWNMGLGTNTTLAYAAYALSPFNVLYMLDSFVSDNTITLISIVVRIGLTASMFTMYMKKSHDTSGKVCILMSTLYSLCSYQILYACTNIMWLDAMWLLPLLFNEINNMVWRGKNKGLIWCYSYIFITNFYMGYMVGVASFLYFLLICYFQKNEIENLSNKFIVYGLSVICSIGMSAFVWVPTAMQTFGNSLLTTDLEALKLINVIDVYNQLFLGTVGTLNSTGPNIYCGLLVVILLPFCAFTNSKKNKAYWGLLIILLLACVIKPLYLFAHAFDVPNGWDYRFSFIISFVVCVLSAETISKRYVYGKTQLFSIVMINAMIYILIMFSQEKRKLVFRSNTIIFLVINLCFLVAYAFLIYGIGFEKRRALLMNLIIVVAFSECVFSGYLYHTKREEFRPEIYEQFRKNWNCSINELGAELEKSGEIARININNEFAANSGLYSGCASVSYLCSSENIKQRQTLSKLGLWTTPRSVRSIGLNPITEMLLGIDYEVYGPNYDELIIGKTQNAISENKRSLGIAYGVDEKIKYCFLNSSNAFDNIDEVVSCMLGESIDVFDNIQSDDITVNSSGIIVDYSDGKTTFSVADYADEGEIAFIDYVVPKMSDDVYGYISNSESIYDKDGFLIAGGKENSFYQYGVCDVSYIKKLDRDEYGGHFTIYSNNGKVSQSFGEINFSRLNMDKLDYAYKRLSDNAIDIKKIRNNKLQGALNMDKEKMIVFFAIPFDKGWRAYIDSRPCTIIKLVDDTFCGIEVFGVGEHLIELEYEAPGVKCGIYMSLVTGALMMPLAVWKKRSNL